MRVIDAIVLHTAAAYNHKTGKVVHQRIEDIDRYHREHNGWRKIGYHWFVDENGIGWRGRQDDEVGAHAVGFNVNSLGLCVSGHGDYLPWNEKQMREVVAKCAAWAKQYHVPVARIIGHREVDDLGAPNPNKTCPGMLVGLSRVREMIQDRMETVA